MNQPGRAVATVIAVVDDLMFSSKIRAAATAAGVTVQFARSRDAALAASREQRPALVVLSAGAHGYKGTLHHQLAAVVEFIHTATLLHDDVVDESDMRRGRRTANAEYGNAASVLVGDFLYSRAFQMMVGVGSMRVMSVLADATNAIAEGEVLQLTRAHDLNLWCAGGLAALNGGGPGSDELPPLKAFGQQAGFQAGLNAAVASLAALYERLGSGEGQLVEISAQECITSILEMTFEFLPYMGLVASRLGQKPIQPLDFLNSIDFTPVVFNMLTLKGIYGREMYETWYRMSVMVTSGLDIRPVITHELSSRDFEEGFAIAASGVSANVCADAFASNDWLGM